MARTAQKRPWLAWYPADYMRDTLHLTLEQHGCYLRLIMTAWQRGDTAIPNDERYLRGLFPGMHGRSFNAFVRPVLNEFWTIQEDGKWHNKRLDEEAEIALKQSRKQSERATKRWRNAIEIDLKETPVSSDINNLADAVAMPTRARHNHNHIKKEERKKTSSSKESAVPPDWVCERFEAFWAAYPHRPGDPKKPALQSFYRAVKDCPETADPIIDGAGRFKGHLKTTGKAIDEFVPMAATWLNQERWVAAYPPKPKYEPWKLRPNPL